MTDGLKATLEEISHYETVLKAAKRVLGIMQTSPFSRPSFDKFIEQLAAACKKTDNLHNTKILPFNKWPEFLSGVVAKGLINDALPKLQEQFRVAEHNLKLMQGLRQENKSRMGPYDPVEHRKNWRINWLSCLNELSSSVHQQRWLDKRNRNPHWTYTEFRCCYFDDLGLSRNAYEEALKGRFVSQQEFKVVECFHIALRAYKPPNGYDDSEAIINDKHWQEIVYPEQ